jgi:hypothetical protein
VKNDKVLASFSSATQPPTPIPRSQRVDEKELRANQHRYYFFGNAVRDVGSGVHRLIETCIPLALFEVTLDNLDERFRISDFTQEMAETPRNRHSGRWVGAPVASLRSRNLRPGKASINGSTAKLALGLPDELASLAVLAQAALPRLLKSRKVFGFHVLHVDCPAVARGELLAHPQFRE